MLSALLAQQGEALAHKKWTNILYSSGGSFILPGHHRNLRESDQGYYDLVKQTLDISRAGDFFFTKPKHSEQVICQTRSLKELFI